MTYTSDELAEEIRRLETPPQLVGNGSPDEWVNDPRHPDGFHRRGVIWYDATLPWRWHRCRPWSRITLSDTFRLVERCACGCAACDGRRRLLLRSWRGARFQAGTCKYLGGRRAQTARLA